MLVRFSVENYLSFKDKTEFNMLTGNPRRLTHHVYTQNGVELLKMAAIYGANGSGKSNFVEAIVVFRNLISFGLTPFVSDDKRFKLNEDNDKLPISFEIEFITNGVMFFYSIDIEHSIIVKEKLCLSKTEGDDELIFERLFSNNKISINFNEKYRQTETDKLRIKLYEDELLKNEETLFSKLNESREGFSIVKQAFNWFLQIKTMRPNLSVSHLVLINPLIHDFVKTYIKDFNIGITDFQIVSYSFDQYFGENNKQLKEQLKEQLKTKSFIDLNKLLGFNEAKSKIIAVFENDKYVIKILVTYHLDNKDNKIPFDPNEESDGTIRLWDLLPAIYFVLNERCLVIIDEIENSIHPYLLKELIRKFSENKETKGQLVFTTHESNLLDQEIFRQDEIWFAEKNTEGATSLFPMSDFNVRYDLDIRKGYLNGRFGAIPFLSNFNDLNWKPNAE
jgi:uncharacterized protein